MQGHAMAWPYLNSQCVGSAEIACCGIVHAFSASGAALHVGVHGHAPLLPEWRRLRPRPRVMDGRIFNLQFAFYSPRMASWFLPWPSKLRESILGF